jgi:hypothetical protein
MQMITNHKPKAQNHDQESLQIWHEHQGLQGNSWFLDDVDMKWPEKEVMGIVQKFKTNVS